MIDIERKLQESVRDYLEGHQIILKHNPYREGRLFLCGERGSIQLGIHEARGKYTLAEVAATSDFSEQLVTEGGEIERQLVRLEMTGYSRRPQSYEKSHYLVLPDGSQYSINESRDAAGNLVTVTGRSINWSLEQDCLRSLDLLEEEPIISGYKYSSSCSVEQECLVDIEFTKTEKEVVVAILLRGKEMCKDNIRLTGIPVLEKLTEILTYFSHSECGI